MKLAELLGAQTNPQVVAVVIADATVAACKEAITRLDTLAGEVPDNKFLPVVLALDGKADELVTGHSRTGVVRDKSVAAALLASAGIKGALMLPEIILFDATTSPTEVLSTDGWARLKRGGLTVDTFSRRGNCYKAAPLPDSVAIRRGGPWHTMSSARLSEASAISARLYPGDAVIVRPLVPSPGAVTTSLTAYVNAPPEDEDAGDSDSEDSTTWVDEEEAAAAATPPDDTLWLPALAFADLGLVPGQTCCLQEYSEVPEATEVTLEPLTDSPAALRLAADSAAAVAALSSFFGLQSPDTSASTVAALETALSEQLQVPAEDANGSGAPTAGGAGAAAGGAGAGNSSTSGSGGADGSLHLLNAGQQQFLRGYLRASACKRLLVTQMQTVAVPNDYDRKRTVAALMESPLLQRAAAGYAGYAVFRVIATQPRYTAVIVGPDTHIKCVLPPPTAASKATTT